MVAERRATPGRRRAAAQGACADQASRPPDSKPSAKSRQAAPATKKSPWSVVAAEPAPAIARSRASLTFSGKLPAVSWTSVQPASRAAAPSVGYEVVGTLQVAPCAAAAASRAMTRAAKQSGQERAGNLTAPPQ